MFYIHRFVYIKHRKYKGERHETYAKNPTRLQILFILSTSRMYSLKKKAAWKFYFLGKTSVNCKQIGVAYFLKTILLSLNTVDNPSASQIPVNIL